ncbi:MAG: hypothetical protein AAGH38_07020 [Pseudomonadota bacterium]
MMTRLDFLVFAFRQASRPGKALRRHRLPLAIAGLVCIGATACDQEPEELSPEVRAAQTQAILSDVISSPERPQEDILRDRWRHPGETLAFFGMTEDMDVIEIWPGYGWYTNILAPFLTNGPGTLTVATVDPSASDEARGAVTRLEGKFRNKSYYGDVETSVFFVSDTSSAGEPKPETMFSKAPEKPVDLVLSFRNLHNWIEADQAEFAFSSIYGALKPGGVFGLVAHRAAGDQADFESHGGYVTEATAISLAISAGFVLDERSEINANPADTRDHPFGVWTLPPVLRQVSMPAQTATPDVEKYKAIGESDRMTLRFKKLATPPPNDGAKDTE